LIERFGQRIGIDGSFESPNHLLLFVCSSKLVAVPVHEANKTGSHLIPPRFTPGRNSLNGVLLANGNSVAQASTSIRLPEVWTGGIAFWPMRNRTREWKVEVDVDYVRWQAIRDASVLLSNGSRLPNPQQWKNTFTVNVGTEYKWVGLTDNHAWDVAFHSLTQPRHRSQFRSRLSRQ
jgi:hypothetical protein